MRITVCEITNDQAAFPDTWKALREHAARERSELLLLPEFAFLPAVWEREREAPGEWNGLIDRSLKIPPRFPELGCTWIVGAAPATEGGRRRIQGFAWTAETGVRPLRSKAYLPDEAGSWERRWFEPGPPEFPAFTAGALRYGLNICTELWAMESVARYPSLGVEAILTPRATALATTERWMNLAKTVAVRTGAFSLSSNRRHSDGSCGGVGWIVDPEGREIARTSEAEPFITREVDLAEAARARSAYPRYVFDERP